VRADQGVRVSHEPTALDVDGAEHLLAALAGLGIRCDVVLHVEGGEVPLLDGGALAFATALADFAIGAGTPELVVVREETLHVGAASYAFEPWDRVALDVEIDFTEPGIGRQCATWNGTRTSFVRDIAWARTFGFRRDAERLWARGRARGVDAASVMVLDAVGRVEPPGIPPRPEEFARHKLLDLIGDASLYGGPPVGKLRAVRPGHAATHHAMTEALARGILRRDA
jgi:UDP-3-O-[3-hydroxymyristoyl] N-acetylglucosamine deacetylase